MIKEGYKVATNKKGVEEQGRERKRKNIEGEGRERRTYNGRYLQSPVTI